MGRLGTDIEVSYTSGGTAIGKFSLATSEKYKGEEKTEWHRCVAWAKTAEIMAEYLNKGDAVLVEGKIQYGKYEDKEGITRYTTDINVFKFFFLPKVKDNAARPEPETEDSDIPF
jgi:single-strand DNA-binding protein